MFELPEFIYYSFYTGRAGSLRKSWKLHDIKMPAFELKQAVTMFLWQYDYVIKKNSPVMPGKEIWRDPSPHRIKHVIRKVISFKLVRSKGKTQPVYKKHQEFSQAQVMALYGRYIHKLYL